ncbi:MAG: hypothetical protein JWL69_1734 [Phycisphaerales bacterium]|nr:hypothetical protein [Phycisphaerales bacterium]
MNPGITPLGYQSASPAALVKGQTGLVVFGIISILLGAGSGCMGLLAPIALLIPQPQGAGRMQAGAIISGAVLYLGVAGGFIWLGVGSIRKRRWVRPIVLAVMSLALVVGVFTAIAAAFTATNIQNFSVVAGPAPAPSATAMHVAVGVMIVTMLVFFVGLPAAFILFYRKPEVRAALEYFDPTPRWTDNCPIPVLVVSAGLVMAGASMLMTIPQGMAPFFGTLLTGAPAMGLLAIEAMAALLLAFLTAKLRPGGWWGTVAFLVIYVAMVVPTSLRTDLSDLYANAGFTAEQVKMMRQLKTFNGAGALMISVPMILLSLGYLLYVRKFFVATRGSQRELPPIAE